MQIDTTSNNYTWIGDEIYSGYGFEGWGDPIIGADQCIYWPPSSAKRVLKFDPETQHFPSRLWGMTSVKEVPNGMVEL